MAEVAEPEGRACQQTEEEERASRRHAGRLPRQRCPTCRPTTCPTARTRPPMSNCAASASRRSFNFAPMEHFELGETLGLMDFDRRRQAVRRPVHRAARQARPAGAGARPVHARSPHQRVSATPKSCRRCWCATTRLYGTGQLPKFAEDLFRTDDRPLADPDRRSAADQPRRRPASSTRRSCRSASPR